MPTYQSQREYLMNNNNDLTLLIADDDDIVRTGLASLLEAQDGIHVVATAIDGSEAIARMREYEPDVALLDIDMPIMDGITAAKVIVTEYPRATVIMLTAFEREETLAAALALGVRGFLTKDTQAPELAELIKQAHKGVKVMGARPIEMLTASYIASQHNQEDFRDFINAIEALSERHRPIYNLLVQSKTNRVIARELNLSESTVRNYVSEILGATGCTSRGQLAMTAVKAGLLS